MSKKIKLKRKYWEKGKSKFLEHRQELQNIPDFSVSTNWLKDQDTKIMENIKRRAEKKINQQKHLEEYYNDCYYNSEEFKNYKEEQLKKGIIVIQGL